MKQCRHGLMLFNRNDQYIGRSLALYGEFSELENDVFQQVLRGGCVVVDAGANIGAHTLCFAQAVGPTGVVHAFEPQRLVFQTLCANLALNSIANVHCYHGALGAASGTIQVPALDQNRENNFGGLSLREWSDGDSVPLMTIDGLGLSECDFIKIDVEGMEAEVLRGGIETIRRCRPGLYVENDRQEQEDELVELIRGLGYRLWWHTPALYNPDNYEGNDENVFVQVVSINMQCMPAEAEVNLSGFTEIV